MWDPPRRLGYLWHIRRDPRGRDRRAVDFEDTEGGSRIRIEHTGWERLGAEGSVLAGRQPRRLGRSAPHFTLHGSSGTGRMNAMDAGQGTAEDPWVLKTAPGTSEYQLYRDPDADPPALVCVVGTTTLKYHLRAVEDLHAMLVERGDWVELGAADEQKPAKDGTVEAWGRDESNPVGGWYGLRKGYRGRFGMYLPPLLEHLGLVELEHNPRNNRVRAK